MAIAIFDLSDLDGGNGFVLDAAERNPDGMSVSSAGDVNGDGFDDVIIGNHLTNYSISMRGQSYLVFGKAGGYAPSLDLSALDGDNGFVLDGTDDFGRSGFSVSSAGDVNADGYDDLIVGAPYADPHGQDWANRAGESYLVFGQAEGFAASLDLATLDGDNGFALKGIDQMDSSGFSVSSTGDLNGDGFDDIIIGAPSLGAYGSFGAKAGESYVVFGKGGGFTASLDLSTLDGDNGFVLKGIIDGDGSGRAVSSAGDVNGDGFDDLIIGAPGADPNGETSAGESYVVFGKGGGFGASFDLSTLDGENGFVLKGTNYDPGARSGSSVSSAGDVNNDGFDDIIIGAPGLGFKGARDAGGSYVVFGKAGGFTASLDLATLDGSDGFLIKGINYDWDGLSPPGAGYAVSSAGDVNGDGHGDLIIGAPFASPHGSIRLGESYVVFGKADGFSAVVDLSALNGSNGFSLYGIDDLFTWTFEGEANGASVSSAGDVNADGFDDLIIGAEGASYVVFGGPQFGITPNVQLVGSHHADSLIGSIDNEILIGKGGDDTLVGLQGDDVLYGGCQRDLLRGGGGDDILSGDQGRDRLFGGHGNDVLKGGALGDKLMGGDGDDTLDGGDGWDRLQGGSGNDLLLGGAGSNRMFGQDGDDTVVGGPDADLLEGGAGNDALSGAAGSDVLEGGAGNDQLWGYQGSDRFVFSGESGDDTIVDFSRWWDWDDDTPYRDVIEIRGYGDALDEFTDLVTTYVSETASTLIDLNASVPGAGTILLVGFTELDADDFAFG